MEHSCTKSQDVIACFDRFYNHYVCVLKERDEYLEKIKSCSSENERLVTSNDNLQRDLDAMHEMVGNFHKMVSQIDTLKDSNTALKEKCCALEQEMKTKEQSYQEKLEEQRKESEEKLTLVIKSREKNAENEKQRLVGQLEEKTKDILQLKEAMASAKKEKEDEITVLSMEYENKLAKVQRQKPQILQNAQQDANQDIFRKKLSHMKKTHEEEVATLKQQIAQLQSQAAARPPRAPSPQVSQFTSVFTTRNKRK